MNGPLLLGDRPLPHSGDMEKAALNCFMCWPDEMKFEFDRVRSDDFYVPQHRRIFESIKSLVDSSSPVDLMTIAAKLEESKILDDVGGYGTLREISNTVPSCANYDTYITEVQTHGRARRLIALCSDVAGKLFSGQNDVNEIVANTASEVIKVSNEGSVGVVKYVRDCVDESASNILGIYNKDPNALGISTGYKEIDEMIRGAQGGKTYIIAARPSIGKTSFILNVLSRMAMVEKVAFFSLEMTDAECTEKLISLFGGIDMNDVYAETIEPQELIKQIATAKRKLNDLGLIIDDNSYKFEDLCHRIKLLYVKEGIKAVGIDYLQLMEIIARTDNREQAISKMSASLKTLAKDLNIPIFILAQLNRKSEGKEPILSDLRDSGAIEQDADVVVLLHRERADSQEMRQKVERGEALDTRLIFAKNRGGKVGPIDLWFFPQFSNFQEPFRVKNEDIPE